MNIYKMCFMSQVYTHYDKQIVQQIQPQTSAPNIKWEHPLVLEPQVDLNELKKLIDEFKESMQLAKKLDILMQQKDCVDPEKAKLEERVTAIEKLLEDQFRKVGRPA